MNFASKTAIAGIGQTEFSKYSGRSVLRLAVESCDAAIRDAGLKPDQIDGMVSMMIDDSYEIDIQRNLGIASLTHFSRVNYAGGSGCATVHMAAMAVASGACNYALVYRAFNERSEARFGVGVHGRAPAPNSAELDFSWSTPFGLLTPASWVAMSARRYMYEHGVSSEDFGRIAVLQRQYAATNPNAFFYEKPITLEDHQSSRWIVKPFRLLDCCQESDGGVAMVVTTMERARDLAQSPAVITASAQGSGPDQNMMKSYYRPSITDLPEAKLVAEQLWRDSGLKPGDMSAAILYEHFTVAVLQQLEAYGFCPAGDAADFLKDGHLELDGTLPVNMHGGHLGEAYIHGMNGINEAVRQTRGQAVNQVSNPNHILVTSGTGVPTSGLILSRDII
jgi:acetyl-CoA acetyltransferase